MTDPKNIETFKQLNEKRNEKHFDWVKHILLVASGLLGVLVSLRSTKSGDEYQHYAFIATVSALGLGILTGSIHLYAEVNAMNRLQDKLIEQIKKESKGQGGNPEIINAGPLFVFTILEWTCYCSLLIATISLVTYAILTDI